MVKIKPVTTQSLENAHIHKFEIPPVLPAAHEVLQSSSLHHCPTDSAGDPPLTALWLMAEEQTVTPCKLFSRLPQKYTSLCHGMATILNLVR